VQPEKRREPRAPGYAKAVLEPGKVPGYVRDLSPSGCHVAFLQPTAAEVGEVLSITVIPEHDPSIRPFVVRLRVRRIVKDPPWYSVGAEVEGVFDPAEQQAFDKLVSYYSRR